jgi:cytochrome d ubiquinol oxidase subunit I
VFYAFRLMVGVGMAMLAVSWLGLWLLRRRGWAADRLPRPMLWTVAGMTFSGWVATVSGWYVTEIGRQPYMVQGLLRVEELASSVPSPMIALTLTLYVTVYLALLVAYIGVLRHMAEKPVDLPAPVGAAGGAAARPSPAGAAP